MQLEQSLDTWEASAKKIRRRILMAVAVYAATIFLHALFVAASNSMRNGPMAIVYGVLLWGNLIALFASFVIGLWSVGLYFFKYAPGLKRARFDVQTAMMLELQQQVESLREEVKRREK